MAGLAVLVVLLPLTSVPLAAASVPTCDPSTVTVTPMESPDGTPRPMYVDIAHGATMGSGYVGYELTGASGVLGSDVWVQLSNFTGVVGLATNQSAAIPARATSQGGHPLVYAYLTASATSSSAQNWTVEVWNGKPGQTGSNEVCTKSDGFSEVDNVISANANKITSIAVSTASPAIGGSVDVTAVGDTGTMGAGPSTDQSGGNGVFSMAPSMDNSWPADTFTLTGVQVTIGGSTQYDKLRVYPGTSAAGAYTAVYHFTVRGSAGASTPIVPVQNIASGTQVKYTGSYPPTTSIAAPVQTASLVKSASNYASGNLTYQVVVSNTSAGPVTLDYVQDSPTPTSGWTFVTGSATLNGSAIADPTNSSGLLIFGGPFTVPAASGSTAGTITFRYTLHLTATVTNAVVGSVGGQVLAAPSGTQNEVTVDPTAPIVTTASLPDAVNGTAYSQTLAASSGTAPYSWSVTAGSLPTGLTLTASTGRIAGTPTVAGTSTFTVTVTDSQGTPKSGSKSLSITVADPVVTDTTAPSGSVTLDGGATTTSSALASVALAATDAVGVTAYRVAEGSDCSGASWVVVSSTTSFSSTTSLALSAGDGTKTVCAQYKDAAGNVSTTATATVTLDTTAPTVALSSTAANPTNGPFTVTATFSEAVTGFALGDLTVGNGAASVLTGSGTTYTFTVTPAVDGAVTVDLPAGGAADAAGNANTAAPQLTRTYDTTKPSVTLASAAANPTNAPFTVTGTFSEAVSGFTLADLAIGNGTASALSGSGTTYTFTVTPTADGSVTVDLPPGGAADSAGNANTAAPRLSRTYDGTRPAVTLTSAAANPTNSPFTVTATFSEAVAGFALGDLSVGNGSASALSGSGSTYTFTVTPAADGAVTVDLPAGGAADPAGNTNTAAAQLTRTYDTTRPSVTLTSAAANPTNAPFTVTATFSEAVSGLALAGLSVGNGTASGLAGSGTTYTLTVTPAADGAVTVDLPAGGVADAAGNTNTAATQLMRTYDATRPSVTLSSAAANPTNGAFTVTATFSEAVTGFALGDLTIGNGAASALSGSGTTYTFTVTPAVDGAVTIDLPAGGAADGAGNTNTAATQLARAYDATRPSVTLTSGAANPTNAPFTVTATFSETVTGFALGDLAIGNGVASGLSGTGATYLFTVTPSADGPVTVDLPGSGAADPAGNTNTAATELTRTYDATRPSVTLTTAASNPTNGPFTVAATFSEPISGLTPGDLTIGNGTASALTGSGATYTFTVTPSADGSVTVDVPSAAVADAAGNSNTAAATLSRTFDTARPSVALSTLAPNPTNAPFAVIVTFSKPVTGFTLTDVTVANGSASALSGSGALYSFTVTSTADGTVTVGVPAGVAIDSAGNANTAAPQLTRAYDATRPGVALSTSATDPTNARSFTVRATFTKPVSGLGIGAISVGNGTASNLQGSGAVYTFTVSPAEDGPVTIDLAASSATDTAGNPNTAASLLALEVDRTPPVVSITTPAALIAFAADDLSATLTCSLDGAPFVGCTSPFAPGDLANGLHTFEVQATDPAGNSSTASTSWTVGAPVPPKTSIAIISAPPAVTPSPSATITFAQPAPTAKVTCRLDGGAYAACTSPLILTGLAAGQHTLEVRAVDATGSVSTAATTWMAATGATPDVRVQMSSSTHDVLAGKQFHTTATATNVGGATAEDVTLRIDLPPNTELVRGDARRLASAKDFPCTVDGSVVSCPVGTLEPGARFVVELDLRAISPGTLDLHANTKASNARRAHAAVRLNARHTAGRGCTIYGRARIVRGTSGDDVICLSPGFHIVYALSGNDVVYGSSGTQIEYGGSGNDRLYGGAGDDYLDGGSGNDDLRGGTGNDKLLGRAGNDVLAGGPGKNRLHGGRGIDRELWHAGDVVFEIAPGPVRVWRKTWLSPDVPLITHYLTRA